MEWIAVANRATKTLITIEPKEFNPSLHMTVEEYFKAKEAKAPKAKAPKAKAEPKQETKSE